MSRGISPVVGVVLLSAIAVLLSAVVGGVVVGAVPGLEHQRPVALSVTASAEGNQVTLLHEAGPPLDVEALTVRVSVGGTPLDHQPPVPFFAAKGFESGPTGPFNSASGSTWTPGERASFAIAGTNSPILKPGARIEVRVMRANRSIAAVETTVE